MNLADHIDRQTRFSQATFGLGQNTGRLLTHIRKELAEIEAKPDDIYEWVDLIILAIDGATRMGFDGAAISQALQEKQSINESRQWPDWRSLPPDQPIEHVRTAD
jgi:hypothetical protein